MAGAALPIPTKTGYTFDGWYESSDFTGNPVADVPTDSTGELTFYAKWTANTYTVIFDADGGSVDPTSAVTVAGKLTSLPIPTYDGYNFLGWYTQKDGGGIITTDTVFAMDSTIYAHWSNIPVTSLELNKYSLTLQEKGSDTLTVAVEPADAANQDVTWESSNTSIATVSADGTVEADWAATQTKVLADIPATGHNYDNGKCTVCGAIASDFKAVITAGANGSWQKGTKDGLSFTSNAAYKHFRKVQVDGKNLDAANYTVKEGGTIVTLKAEYLETLSVGKHTLAIVSDTGTAAAEFTIQAAPATDNTRYYTCQSCGHHD